MGVVFAVDSPTNNAACKSQGPVVLTNTASAVRILSVGDGGGPSELGENLAAADHFFQFEGTAVSGIQMIALSWRGG